MGTFGSSLWGGGASGQAAIPQGVPVKPLFYMALRLAHVTKFADASANAPSPDQLGDCLQQAQLMIDQAQIKHPMILGERITDYVLGTAEKYTLGPGGTLISTTGTSVRPVQIDRAKLILPSGTPVYLDVFQGSFREFSDLAVQKIPGAPPRFLYCDYGFPLATVYLIPQDAGGDTLELYDWQPIPTLQAVSDLIALAPGYQDWFVNKLAIRLAAIFEERGAWVSEDTKDEARRAERAISSRNTSSPRIKSDFPGVGRGGFNYLDGMNH